MKENLNESFEKMMIWNFPRYKGKVIERLSDGFLVFSQKVPDWESATKAIDDFYEKFPAKINHLK
jgi:hypothetical protein